MKCLYTGPAHALHWLAIDRDRKKDYSYPMVHYFWSVYDNDR